MFAKPKVGAKITVTTDHSELFKTSMPHVRAAHSKNTTTGVVVDNPKWVDADCFCVTTGKPHFPVAVISLDLVCDLRYLNGEEAAQIEEPSKEDQTWSVKGSGKKFYTVTKKGNTWSCTCPGFTYHKKCKHVSAKKEELAA